MWGYSVNAGGADVVHYWHPSISPTALAYIKVLSSPSITVKALPLFSLFYPPLRVWFPPPLGGHVYPLECKKVPCHVNGLLCVRRSDIIVVCVRLCRPGDCQCRLETQKLDTRIRSNLCSGLEAFKWLGQTERQRYSVIWCMGAMSIKTFSYCVWQYIMSFQCLILFIIKLCTRCFKVITNPNTMLNSSVHCLVRGMFSVTSCRTRLIPTHYDCAQKNKNKKTRNIHSFVVRHFTFGLGLKLPKWFRPGVFSSSSMT